MKVLRELHARIIRNGGPACLISQLVNYTNESRLWTSVLRAFSQSDRPADALHLFDQMRIRGVSLHPLTFIFFFKACARLHHISHARKAHLHCLKLGFHSHLFLSNVLIHMYAACADLPSSRKVFDAIPGRDLVSWNSLICGYSQHNHFREVLTLFQAMQLENVKPDAVTMVKVLLASTHLGDADYVLHYIQTNNVQMDVYLGNTLIDLYGRRGSVESAQSVFYQMTDKNIVSWNAMITTYAKAGNLDSARVLFDKMPVRDVISWTSMITGYSHSNRFSDALTLFREMMVAKVKPDEITLSNVLSACAHLGALDTGKAVHNYIHAHSNKADLHVGNALIDMYFKCGCIKKALGVFEEMAEKDGVSWTSIITGLAVNGYAKEALRFFSHMLKEGVQPRDVTFVGVLVACTHAGLVDEGLHYFESMKKVHRIEPRMKHYGCIVDLLSRSGFLDRAYEFITSIPITPDAIVWRILLSACKVHGNVILAEIALKKLLALEPNNSGNYVLLSNTYAGADRWDEAVTMRKLMKESYVQKAAGCSSIEVNGPIPTSITKDSLLPEGC